MAPGRERLGPARTPLAGAALGHHHGAGAAFAAAKNLKRDFGEVEHLQISEKGPGAFVSLRRHQGRAHGRAPSSRAPGRTTRFLGEEGGGDRGPCGRTHKIVDPLDGTTNFLHGVRHFALSIVQREGEIIAGVIYQPISDLGFWAERR